MSHRSMQGVFAAVLLGGLGGTGWAASPSSNEGEGAWQSWLREPAPVGVAANAEWERRGVALARRHADDLVRRLRLDPETALVGTLTLAQHRRLPASVREVVEAPFSWRGEISVTPNRCPSGAGQPVPAGPAEDLQGLRYTVWLDGRPTPITITGARQSMLSKKDTVVQGVRLGDCIVARVDIFQVMEEDDRIVAQAEYPWGQPDPTRSVATGKPLTGPGIVALAGGRLFAFASAAECALLEKRALELEASPGLAAGVASLFDAASSGEPMFTAAAAEEERLLTYPPTVGPKTALILRVDFADRPGEPIAADSLASVINTTVSSTLRDFSQDLTSISGTVAGATYRMPQVSTAYTDVYTLWEHAVAAYVGAGHADPTPLFDTIGVYFTALPNFSWAGLANVGGQRLWLNGYATADVIAHELGHNYGLAHASAWYVTGGNPVDPVGSSLEYGDVFDLMGGGASATAIFMSGRSCSWAGWGLATGRTLPVRVRMGLTASPGLTPPHRCQDSRRCGWPRARRQTTTGWPSARTIPTPASSAAPT